MAGQPPDARTLNSWEDAFQHPLPVVRRLEAQLRKNMDDNRQKLRTLVGASYRELLGTAERIIEMDEQMQTVEGHLGGIGKNCNVRVVDRTVENHQTMRTARREEGGLEREERSVLAQTKVLQTCMTAALRILKARGDALQAAKLYVLSRLLHRSIAETRRPPAVLGDLRRKLHGLRHKLLSYTEQDMAKISADTTRLPHTLCAYVLVASSTPKDALRHFLQVRYDQLDRQMDFPSETEVLESLALYGQTLIDTRELFPRKVAEVLGQISRSALLQDGQVTSLVELNLDIYGSWIPRDIRTFTPWVRHDQLVSSEVLDALTAWTEQARNCLLERLGDHLNNQTNARELLESRYRFLSQLLQLSSHVKDVTSAYGMEQVRSAFLSRLSELAEQAAGIKDLALDGSHMVEPSGTTTSDTGIWGLAFEDFDLSHGGIKLRRSILAARHGRNVNMTAEMTKIDDWTKRIHEYLDIADDMAATRWEEDLDFDSEFSGAESLEQELSKQDPELLRERLRSAVQMSLKEISQSIQAVGESTPNPAFYIRLWRELDLRCRALEKRLRLSSESLSLTDLYRNVGSVVLKDVVFDFVQTTMKSSPPSVALWDGSPPLPVQCSPQTFRFLTTLHQSMAALGSDLWTAACVAELKSSVVEKLGRELGSAEAFTQPAVEAGKENGEILTNGHAETETEEEDTENSGGKDDKGEIDREQVVQRLFDTHYLLHLLSVRAKGSPTNAQPLDELFAQLQERSQLDEAGHERLKKNATEFGKKTYLLFGLLAPAREGGAVG